MKLPSKFLSTIALSLLVLGNIPALADGEPLPNRTGPRQATTNSVPHMQIGAIPPPAFTKMLLERVATIPDVNIQGSAMSIAGAKGFWLGFDIPLARPEVLVRGREFAHVHPDGSLHASLPPQLALEAVKAGWAIPHPWANQKNLSGFVMLYTPKTDAELDVVFELVLKSYNFVTGRNMVVVNE